MREIAIGPRGGFRPRVTEVWAHNLHKEVALMAEARKTMPYVFVDTEFPGFLRSCPRDASEEDCYEAVRYNVDNLKLIQLGITLADDEGTLSSWQFNLRDFNPRADKHDESSIRFLQKSGINLDRFWGAGVSAEQLCHLLLKALIVGCEGSKWITFHGIYDLAYLVKLLTKGKPLPSTLLGFLRTVRKILGDVYDVKHMARVCSTSFAEVGLVRLSKMLEVTWTGNAHQAGHDSLLTAIAFLELKRRFKGLNEEDHEGLLYGVLQHAKEAKMTTYFPPIFPAQVAPHPVRYVCVYNGSGYWMIPAASMPVHAF